MTISSIRASKSRPALDFNLAELVAAVLQTRPEQSAASFASAAERRDRCPSVIALGTRDGPQQPQSPCGIV